MKRRIAALFMASCLAAGALGTQGMAASEDGGEITNIIVEMVNYGYDDVDLQMVEDAINEITEAKIAVHVDFLTVPISEMATRLGLMVSGGEDIDIVCTGLLTNPASLVSQGLLQPITEYVNDSEVLSKAGDMLEACTINGEIYAYPGTLYPGQGCALIYDKDLAEEYNIEMPERVESEDELTPIFQKVLDSGMPVYPVTMGDGVGAERSFGIQFEGLGDSTYASHGVIVDQFNGTEVVDWYETPEYEKQSRTHQEWFEAGYTVPDSISNGIPVADSMAQGQSFSFMTIYSTGTDEAYYSAGTGRNCGVVMIGDPSISTASIINSSWGIASSSTKIEPAMKFAELIYSDPELATLYHYGIEGVHYVTNEGSRVISYPEGVDASATTYGAFVPMFGDMMQLPVREPHTEDFYKVYEEMGIAQAKASKYLGYNFDPSSVNSQTTAVVAAVAKYGPSLNVGAVDVDTVLPQFIEELKAAGIDDIIAENQKQVDAWLAER